jgi:heme exporter protein A
MISASGISKRFGFRMALQLVDLEVGKGEIVALLGPNGAGKSTLLRILATLTKPSYGEATVAGYRLADQSVAARANIGFVAHQPFIYDDLDASANLTFYARLYGLKQPDRRVREMLKQFDLAERDEPVRTFSRGMQQRLALARALLHKPRVLLLDEPHSGLDRDGLDLLDDTLRSLARKGTAILMATHDIGRAQRLARRVEVLSGGKLVHDLAGAKLSSPKFAQQYDRALRKAMAG